MSKFYASLDNIIGIISSNDIVSLSSVLYSNKYNTYVLGSEWILPQWWGHAEVYTTQAFSLMCLSESWPLCP
jgi:hypothetical protein